MAKGTTRKEEEDQLFLQSEWHRRWIEEEDFKVEEGRKGLL